MLESAYSERGETNLYGNEISTRRDCLRCTESQAHPDAGMFSVSQIGGFTRFSFEALKLPAPEPKVQNV